MEEKKMTDAEKAQEKFREEIAALEEKLALPKYKGQVYKAGQKIEITGDEFAMTTRSLSMVQEKLALGLESIERVYNFFSQVSDMLTVPQRDLMYMHIRNIDNGLTISESEQKKQEAEESTEAVKLKAGK